MLLSILEFLGHLHPVLVHLPIGILLLACLFLWQSKKDRYAHLQSSINLILGLGMVSAILSCITGFLLFRTGDYEESGVGLHEWMGIAVALVSIITFYCRRKTSLRKWQLPLAGLLVPLIFITGHLGGSITHGSDYLTQPLHNLFGGDTLATFKRKTIPDVQEAYLYPDIIQPIFATKCYGCHGDKRQKGRLRLDNPVFILKGGKDGPVLVAGKAEESELIKRILLPPEDERHMAPPEKPQLSGQEIALIKWWIDNSADFVKKVKDIPQPEKIKPLLKALQYSGEERKTDLDIPSVIVPQPDGLALSRLRAMGVPALPIAQRSNYLSVNFDAGMAYPDSAIRLLLPLKKQLLWLKLSNIKLDDSSFSLIGQLQNLRRLELDHTNTTDGRLAALRDLKQLVSLNLVGTPVTEKGLEQLKDLQELHSLFLYQTRVDRKSWPVLGRLLPKAGIDSGGYFVPLLKTDTELVKPPPIKK